MDLSTQQLFWQKVQAGDFERGYFPIPGTDGVYTATCLGAGYSIYSKSEHVDECKELLDYWLDGESELWDAYTSTGKVIVTYGNGADATPNYDLFKPFIDLLNDGKGFYWSNQAWPAGTETEMESLFSEWLAARELRLKISLKECRINSKTFWTNNRV